MYNLPLAPKKSKLCFHHCDQLQPRAAPEGGAAPDGVSAAAVLLRTPAAVLLKMPTSASVAKLCQEKQAGKIIIRQHRIASGCHILS